MYYKSNVERGKRVADYLIIIANILFALNVLYAFIIENRNDLKASLYEIVVDIFIIIVTISYYRGSKLAFRVMRYIMDMTVLGLLVIPILLLTGVLANIGLLDIGDGILALLVPLGLILIVIIWLFKTRFYNDYNSYIEYRKQNK